MCYISLEEWSTWTLTRTATNILWRLCSQQQNRRQINPGNQVSVVRQLPSSSPPHPENTAGLHTWAEEGVEGYSGSRGSLSSTQCKSHAPLCPRSQPLPTEYHGQISPPGALHVCPSSIIFLLPCICPKAGALPPAFHLTHPSRTRSNLFSFTIPSGIPYLVREAWW